ncbi:cupredoxin domain-containing protein [Thauera sp. WH-1]|uniref:cupredoxin domain-containing protein n=1 Tax=Thauera sp. WH-1 TaxID=3398230 RepID=UPI0039FDCD8D
MKAGIDRRFIAAAVSAWAFCAPAAAADHQVLIEKYTFVPVELRIKTGDTVTWVNEEKRVSHSVYFIAANEESERFFPGERWSRTFDQPGRFEYRCGPHPEMLGVVIVED